MAKLRHLVASRDSKAEVINWDAFRVLIGGQTQVQLTMDVQSAF